VAHRAEALTRKTVTVLFCDVVGSTALGERVDPETNRRVALRYFDEARSSLEGHGGTVEKFIGDAVMAVFGVPAVHEDDALRAVQAAQELRTRLEHLNEELDERWGVRLEWRIGINTGEVVVGDPTSTQTIGTGDTFNVAARLQQAARSGEILLGRDTYRLVRDRVVAGPLQSFSLKGKSTEVQTWALEELRVGALEIERRLTSPIVGREEELAALLDLYDRTLREERCRLVTILGQPGVGKSRLARELAARLFGARVVTGRCPPYGEGITFWPIIEIVRRLAGIRGDDSPAVTRRSLAELVPPGTDGAVIEARLAGLLKLAEPPRTEELFWGLRQLFESLARAQPLVLFIEDVHWAEPALLDLIEYLVGWSVGGPILVTCLARPELLEVRPEWATSGQRAAAIALDPLRDEDLAALVANALGTGEPHADLARYIADAAGGNPLFAEEVVRILLEDGLVKRENGVWKAVGPLTDVTIPPTITALIAARIDRLDETERFVLQCAAVVGKEFWGGAVAALATDVDTGAALHSLVRRRLVVPASESSFVGEDSFAFAHALFRDVAYQLLAKSARAELHERIAEWLGAKTGARSSDYAEILGYHLEQAARTQIELAPADDRANALAAAAAGHLAEAGRRALVAGDMRASAGLLLRARDLLGVDEGARAAFVPELGAALRLAGNVQQAVVILEKGVDGAKAVGDQRLAARAAVELGHLRMEQGASTEELEHEARRTIDVFDELGDEGGLARAWQLVGALEFLRCRYASAEEHFSHGLIHAQRAGDRRERTSLLLALASSAVYGPTPVGEGTHRCESMLAEEQGDQILEGATLLMLGALSAMAQCFAPARALAARGVDIFTELGLELRLALAREFTALVPLLAGDLEGAEHELRLGVEIGTRLDAESQLSTVHGMLADILCVQGRFAEAVPYAEQARETARDDLFAQVLSRRAAAKIDAGNGNLDLAAQALREAADVAAGTDALNLRADVEVDLAHVLLAHGRRNEPAVEALETALELYRQKENDAAIARTESALAIAGQARNVARLDHR